MIIKRREHPDHLVDSCKRSSINRMAAGLRLPRYSHGFFLLSQFGKTSLIACLKVLRSANFKYSVCSRSPMNEATCTKFSHVLHNSLSSRALTV